MRLVWVSGIFPPAEDGELKCNWMAIYLLVAVIMFLSVMICNFTFIGSRGDFMCGTESREEFLRIWL